MNELTFAIPCLFGLESVVSREVKRLGLSQVRAEDGRVLACGSPVDIARLNVNLRSGERVQLLLGRFPARDFETLFQGVRALPWEEFIPVNGAFPVKGYTLDSQLHSEPSCQAIVKKAVAERLSACYHTALPESGPVYQIQFALLRDQAALLLDTTGPGLYKRGYRQGHVLAPLRETLAAGLVQLMGFRGRETFCDPFCGSGTICIEAALIALNRAPGLDRSFAAQKWGNLGFEMWSQAAEEALDREFQGEYDIWGGDTDVQALAAAQKNAAAAGVADLLRFRQVDATRLRCPQDSGVIATNPPYGERLLEVQEAEALYRDFGAACARLSPGWKTGLICPHPEFETLFDRPADKRRKLYNGKLKCQFFMYNV